ncbi:GDSL-type esterase/lipase family protein [Rhizocola hellebori]|uniref:GDSL-type esterase/lipase family protein n=1 Tax=Rhizocola hellebori TaxID=1392758 RepID=UPI001944BA6D|nr:GDSL-type esterase/lipase family protein [Rhizocola hellebori]
MFISDAPEYGDGYRQKVVIADALSGTATALPIAAPQTWYYYPSISPDGSTISFAESDRYGSRRQAIVDRVTRQITYLPRPDGQAALGIYPSPTFMSHEGRYLLFSVQFPSEITGGPYNNYFQAARYDRQSGQYTLVGLNNAGGLSSWYSYTGWLSADGQHAYFYSDSPNLPEPNSNGSGYRLFRRDIAAGETTLLGPLSWGFHASPNGRYVARAGSDGISLHDLQTDEYSHVAIPAGPVWCYQPSPETWVSDDATRFIFQACAPNNAGSQYWRYDTGAQTLEPIVSGHIWDFAVAGDAETATFSGPDSIAPGETGGFYDVYVSTRTPIQSEPARYVALGDSYSSGEGTFIYHPDSDSAELPSKCHRSPQAYGPLLADAVNLGGFTFGACSGAVTDDLYVANPDNPHEPAQLDRITSDTEIVTMTIGGNDVGFKQVLESCISRTLGEDNSGCAYELGLEVDERIAALAWQTTSESTERPIHPLTSIFADIHSRAPDAHIYIAGYPRLFGTLTDGYEQAETPSGYKCVVATIGPITAWVDHADAQWLNAKADALNYIINAAVTQAQAQQIPVTYVDPAPFAGHGHCDTFDPWIHAVKLDPQLNPRPESFHPTVTGFQEYKAMFQLAIGQP